MREKTDKLLAVVIGDFLQILFADGHKLK